MGKRGPTPKPTQLKRLEGTYRPDRANPNEAQPDAAGAEPPEWLRGDEQRRRYVELAAPLLEAGLLTEVDVSTLVNLVRLELLAERLEETISVEPVPGSQGQPTADPRWSHLLALHKQTDMLRRQLGMTPSARTSVKVSEQREIDDTEEWLRTYSKAW